MYCAVNPPIGYPELDLGTMAYGLAHEALKSEEYRERLKTLAKEDRYLILDNGADETTVGMSGHDYYDLVTEIAPDEVIAPDVLGDAKATRKAFEEFWPWFEEYKTQREEELPVKLMVVVQGQSEEEWIREALQWANDDRVDVLGIPYDINFEVGEATSLPEDSDHISSKWAARRIALVEKLIGDASLEEGTKMIHLLGMSNLEELAYYRDSLLGQYIRSNDTTAPFAAASEGTVWSEDSSGPKNWSRLDFNLQDLNLQPTFLNLNHYFHAVGDLPGQLKLLSALL